MTESDAFPEDWRISVGQSYHAAQRAAKEVAFRAAVNRFKAERLPPAEELHIRREAARQQVAAAHDAIFVRVMRTHGLPLPDHFFTFLAWEAGLTSAELEVFNEVLEMRTVGIGSMPLDTEKVEELRAQFDDRLVYRYYRDPPEFLTVIHGGTDGLHYGLWYDDPRDGCAAVASYYNNDSCEINWDGNTLLEAIRERLEQSEKGADGYSTDPAEILQFRVRLAVLRESLLEYEPDLDADTNSKFECGTEAYRERSRHFWPDRIVTRDSIGV